jgi:uncharacterized protein YfiM (DUF2279 family)
MTSLRLGLRLAVAGGREALARLAFAAAGVAVGITILLLALTAPYLMQGRADRTAWHHVTSGSAGWTTPGPPVVEAADGALFLAVSDYHDGEPMLRTYVAALGADPPVPPGLNRLPGPGEVAASPAMRRLLESTPDDELDDRFPGRVTMTIGEAGLEHENELVALVGRTPDQLRGIRSVGEVRGFSRPAESPFVRFAFGTLITPFLLFGAAMLLAPVLILIVVMTRVAWAQRERRLAAIRLAGASRMQTAIVVAAETGLAAVAGSGLAWIGYELGRRVLAATVTFQGGRFWLDDVAVGPWLLVLVLAGTPALVMLTAIVSVPSVQFSPLATSRGGRRPRPTIWHVLPLVAGVGGAFAIEPLQELLGASYGQLSALVTLLTVVGLVVLGPWLCLMAGRGLAWISRGVPGLIAARRIAIDPGATFRAVSGVVLAVMAVTYLGSTSTQFLPLGQPDESRIMRLRPGVVHVITGGVPADRVAPLLSEQVVLARPGGGELPCVDLARVRLNVTCPPGEQGRTGPSSDTLPIVDVYVLTDGTLAAENRVRTQAANLVPNAIINSDRDPVDYGLETLFADFNRLVSVASLFVLLIAACSLTAGMIGGLLERRRPFALLRASGMRLGELRWVVLLETSATMVFTSVVGVGLGMVLAYAASRRGGGGWTWPDFDVFIYVGSGVLAALVFSTLALPLLSATTRYDSVRYE